PGAWQRLDALHHLGCDRNVGPAEAPERVADGLVGNDGVALAAGHVEERLRQKYLGKRRHHDRPAELLAHAGELLDDRPFEMREPLLGELAAHGPDHAAGKLMAQV